MIRLNARVHGCDSNYRVHVHDQHLPYDHVGDPLIVHALGDHRACAHDGGLFRRHAHALASEKQYSLVLALGADCFHYECVHDVLYPHACVRDVKDCDDYVNVLRSFVRLFICLRRNPHKSFSQQWLSGASESKESLSCPLAWQYSVPDQ